jgi:CysZ protein
VWGVRVCLPLGEGVRCPGNPLRRPIAEEDSGAPPRPVPMTAPSPAWGAPPPPRPPRPGVGGPVAGAADVLRGIGLFLGTPGVRLLGIVPVLLAGLLLLGLLGLLVAYLDELADLLTPFADRWDERSRTLVRVGTGLVVLLGSTALLVVSFAVICQIIGQPFYERISDRIEHRLGAPPPGTDTPWWRSFPRASLESALLLAMTLACTAPLFVLGLFPVVGQTVVPVLQALVAGFFLAVELLAIPLERRGLRLGGRLRFVWRHRAQTLGFGITAFLLFLVPLMNVLAMPGAVVGATLLVRRLSGDQVVGPGPR